MDNQAKNAILAVRNPAAILRLEQMLCGDEESPNLLSPEIREALARGTADPNAARVPLCVDVVLALFDWLLARGWDHFLKGDADLRDTVRDHFHRLSSIAKREGSARNICVEASLVVRYLVAMAASGVDVTDRTQVITATFQNDSFQLPRYWPAPRDKWRQNVTEQDRSRFLTSWERFWSDSGRLSGGQNRHKRDRRKSLGEQFAEQGLRSPTQQQKRRAIFPLRETEMGSDAPPADRIQQSAHAGLSAFAAQVVVDSRPLAVGLRLLERSLRLSPARQTPRRCACLTVIETALFCGFAIHDALNVALRPTRNIVPASFNAGRGCLTAHLACGYHQAILGRIPPQDVDIPLPSHTLELFQRLADCGYQTVTEAFGPKPLDAFLDDVADWMSTSGIRGFLRRLDDGWLYAAHRLAKLNPGVIALLRGDVFGPYRADTSYLTVTEQFLWTCAYEVHDQILCALGLSVPEPREPGRATVQIGKQAASLAALVEDANGILDKIGDPNELAACMSWIQQFHGRRPTADFPHAAAYAVRCGGTPVFFLADKNMGGGRRSRLVPATNSAMEAALAVRCT